ncbi:MAG: 6,7-dimethyl-8-ribityllumazine synthase [Methanothrix harundinacea]|jgi:6,7-dimethyl-8-ribityllumazine synthase|uniref:6,7-dimethyl-8-ribityllumazine synthase n=1 Tax=Methanothrix harundinacea TaxID=301375 RepID=A0A101IJ32_9EURY|nr:MAG: 6,7-dimethyl-8-ribityllumazine synthase [Methanothrix harundinacea]KUK95938.1 MAG: 6,7-dimethyl-8-ribityllumazine synthase [Methanothrix harundinacea]
MGFDRVAPPSSIDGFISGKCAELKKQPPFGGVGSMIKLGFVVAEFNRDITYQMEILGREHAEFLGAEVAVTLMVPGVYDMPLAVKKLIERDDVDAVVTIGCVIQGETGHDEIVAQQASRKIMDLALEFDKPVTLGISGPKMSRMDAHRRIDYSKRAVEAAVKMVRRLGED